MAKNTKPILQKTYGMDPSKVEVIHHGVPYKAVESRDKLKEKYGFSGKSVVSTFGLLSPGKGLNMELKRLQRLPGTIRKLST